LSYLIDHSLIAHDNSAKIYRITAKGLKLLNICNEIEEMVK
jgi:predicted transcriptional regulator